MSDLLDGQWFVCGSGYEISKGQRKNNTKTLPGRGLDYSFKDTGAPYVSPEIETCLHIAPIDPKSPKRSYRIMDHPSLFMEFASLFRHEDIIKFANKYGLLEQLRHGEQTFKWRYNCKRMKLCIGVISHIRAGSSNQVIKEFIKNDAYYYPGSNTAPYIRDFVEKMVYFFMDRMTKALLDENEKMIDGEYELRQLPIRGIKNPTNLKEAFYHYISRTINFHLQDCLILDTNVNDRNTGLDISIEPTNLLSALWLQLSYYISKNLEFKQCDECSSFFEVKAKKRKNERKYCSDRCRVRVGARNRRAKEKQS